MAILFVGILFHPLAALGDLAVDGDASTSAGQRVALVVGNGSYQNGLVPLPNPANDAEALASKLRALNFDVIEALDLDRGGMQTALGEFEQRLSTDLEAALFFYAGHGMEYQGQNYLFPVDAKLKARSDVNLGLIRISDVLDIMVNSNVSTRLIFLDACRDNPLADLFKQRSLRTTRTSSITRGLAEIDATTKVGQGTFVAYATAPGDVAEDGTGDHSPFTAALLEHLDVPGLDIPQLMQRVTKTVAEATNEAQTPWSSSSMRGSFVFNQQASENVTLSTPIPTERADGPLVSSLLEPSDAFDRTMKRSQKHKVQDALSSLGYDVGDAYVNEFRSHIRNAIASWQRAVGIDPDGKLTHPEYRQLLEEAGLREKDEPADDEDQTRPAGTSASGETEDRLALVVRPPTDLGNDDDLPPQPRSETPEEIEASLSLTKRHRAELQFALSRLGHYAGARIDGIFGPRSREAIATWQHETGVTGSGYLTEMQVARLYMTVLPALGPFRADYLREIARPAGSTFRDCTSCPDMIVLPAGRFLMGSSSGGSGSERPARQVSIAKFALGKFEVTSKEWSACALDRRCRSMPSTNDRRPVVGVTWQDAQHYVSWLRGVTGEMYYLPSEAEWEYAARAGTQTVYAVGDRISTEQANYDGSRHSPELARRFRGRTLAGGAFQANAFGLYDMHGNVREWVQDRWHDSFRGAPREGRAWLSGGATERVVRGGSWRDDARMLRSAARAKADPETGNGHTGFRVARKIGN